MPESSLTAFGAFILMRASRAHTAGSFLLRGQKKRTKEKAARRLDQRKLRTDSPALLTHFGAQPNSHKKRTQTWLRLFPKRTPMLGCVGRGFSPHFVEW